MTPFWRGKTGVVCTIGPQILDPASLHRLHDQGMDVARVNGSHGSLDDVRNMILVLRSHLSEAEGGVRILLDLPGNKIRTNNLATPVTLQAGESFVLSPDHLTYPAFYRLVKPGDRISAADGAIQLQVTAVKGTDVHTDVLVGGELANRKGINVRGIHDRIPFDFERDIALLSLAIETRVDYVGLSFVRSSEHVRRVKAQLVGTGVGVVTKIETQEAVDSLEQVLPESDLIMIDRGDLEADVGRAHVPLVTRRVIRRAREHGVPVIVASQFLCSMLERPLPYMAEVSDIAHAVLDGADLLMLSEETAVGRYPFDAVRTLREVARAAETELATDHEVIILAAGPSTGFGSLTTNKHKCMLDVGGGTIIHHQLENLAACGIRQERITVVTGHNHRQIETYLRGEGFRGRFLHNPWFASTNMAASLWLAQSQGPTIVLYGDIIFDRAILADVLATPGEAVLAVDEDAILDPEAEKVLISDGLVIEASKDLDSESSSGEFLGLARFDAAAIRRLHAALDERIKAGGLMDFLTASFAPLHRSGLHLVACPTHGRPWNDNDCLADLDRSRDTVFPAIAAAHAERDAARATVRS